MKEDIKYPYIGKANLDGALVVFYSEAYGRCFRSDSWGCGVRGDYNEKAFTNITREYLSNTWGVVESKEHAEFIINLAELHGLSIWHDDIEIERSFFTFNDCGKLFFYDNSSDAYMPDRKQITIPLPPKAKEWPQVGDKVVTRGGSKGVLLIANADKDGMVVCDFDGEYALAYLNELQKPKSKQDLLIEELQTKLCNNNAVDNYILACDIINGEIEGLSYV